MSRQSLLPKRPPKKKRAPKQPPPSAASSNGTQPQVRSVRSQYTRWARWGLWGMLAVVFAVIVIRGVSDIFFPQKTTRVQATSAQAFPGDEARAFAAHFAQVYLTFSPTRPDDQANALKGLLAPNLRDDGAVQLPSTGHGQRVLQAWVARTKRLSSRRALITVACVVYQRPESTVRYLAIPVAQGANGGLVVDDYPALASLPPTAKAPDTNESTLEGGDADAIEALLNRFLPGYLGGGSVAPEFLAPGVSVQPLGTRYAYEELVSLAQAGAGTPTSKNVLALVRARDTATNAVYTLRYRLQVTLRDRWLIQSVEG